MAAGKNLTFNMKRFLADKIGIEDVDSYAYVENSSTKLIIQKKTNKKERREFNKKEYGINF